MVQLNVKPHPQFTLEGNDVHSTVRISPWQAALGAAVEITTLGGTVQMKIPAGSSSGNKVRLRGRGIRQGHQYVTLEIVLSKPITEEERRLYEQLRDLSSG